MHLAEHTVEVDHLGQGERAERDVDRVSPDEGQLGQLGLLELDLDLGRLGRLTGPVELGVRRVDRDDLRALPGERDRGVAGAAAEVEHPLALERPEQPELRLGGDVRAVHRGVGRELLARRRGAGEAVPGGERGTDRWEGLRAGSRSVGHPRSLAGPRTRAVDVNMRRCGWPPSTRVTGRWGQAPRPISAGWSPRAAASTPTCSASRRSTGARDARAGRTRPRRSRDGLGLACAYVPADRVWGGSMGNALLVRGCLADVEGVALPGALRLPRTGPAVGGAGPGPDRRPQPDRSRSCTSRSACWTTSSRSAGSSRPWSSAPAPTSCSAT